MELEWSGPIVYWRGPAPFHFVAVPAEQAELIADEAPRLTYGWGCIPATARIGATTYTTSLFPREGGYMVPVKVAVRRAEGLDLDDTVTMRLSL